VTDDVLDLPIGTGEGFRPRTTEEDMEVTRLLGEFDVVVERLTELGVDIEKARPFSRPPERGRPVVEQDLAAKAMAHPLRTTLLRELLVGGVASPNELSKRLGEPLTNVSYHVRMLLDLGVIELVETEPRRGALEHYYRAKVRVDVSVRKP
jgi:DNA-binding transcriptional ArsR family regulator